MGSYRDRMTTDTTPPANLASIPRAEFASPGPLRDQLVAAILNGSKTSTTELLVDYEHEGEPLPKVGSRSVVIDSDDRPVAVIEITGVRVVPLAQVDLAHVVDEGRGTPAWPSGGRAMSGFGTARRCAPRWRTPNSPWTTRR